MRSWNKPKGKNKFEKCENCGVVSSDYTICDGDVIICNECLMEVK